MPKFGPCIKITTFSSKFFQNIANRPYLRYRSRLDFRLKLEVGLKPGAYCDKFDFGLSVTN